MIAVNIAILPDKNLQKLTTQLHSQLTSQNQKILLNKGYFPHISLAMGIIEETDISKIKSPLSPTQINLELNQITTGNLPSQESVTSLQIKKTPQILNAQKNIIQLAKQHFLNITPQPSMFYNQNANHFTIVYVANYLNHKQKPENFDPHITLGLGTLTENTTLPTQTFTGQLALFQLGDYCTCRKIL